MPTRGDRTPEPWVPPTWTPPTVDVLAGGPGVPYDAVTSAPVPGRRNRGRIVAAALAVVLVLTGAAGYAAYTALSGGGTQPEDVLPADTVAFVKVDLDPPAGQKVELYRMLQRFPHLTQLTGSDEDLGHWLVDRLSSVAGEGVPGLDVDKDVKPWLGQRVAVAAVPTTGASGVQVVVAVQETDDQAATAAMRKLQRITGGSVDFVTSKGYLIVSAAQGAHSALAAADRGTLASSPQFSSDVASLHSDQVVTGWIDQARAGRLLAGALGAAGLGGSTGLLGGQQPQGRWVLGLHVTDGMVELQVHTLGGKAGTDGAPLGPLTDLVPGAVGVVSISGAGDAVSNGLEALASTAGLGDVPGGTGPLLHDLALLLGTRLTVSVGGTADEPTVVAASHSADPAAALAALNRVVRTTGVELPPLATRVDNDTLFVGSSQAAVDAAGTGALTSEALYRRAVVDADQAQAVGFLDLGKLWELSARTGDPVDAEVRQLAAFGFSSVTHGGDSAITVRLVLT